MVQEKRMEQPCREFGLVGMGKKKGMGQIEGQEAP